MRVSILIIAVIFFGCSLQAPPSYDANSQYVNDTTAIKAYLISNGIDAIKLSPGIWFIVDSAASGIRPTFGDTILVSYKMKLLANGNVADQSTTPATFILSQLIFGVRNTMPYFQKGSRGRIFIPSYYGYQNVTYAAIPANSNLIFDFKLNGVQDGRLKKDTVTINNYLKAHSINAQTDVSGLRYTIDSLGTGPKPLLTDSILVTYAAKDLATGTPIEQVTKPAKALVSDLILGWQIGFSNIPEGSKVTFYVPSSLTWLPNSTNPDPTYSNLLFNLKLQQVIRH